jgi:ankyrin repeat protein
MIDPVLAERIGKPTRGAASPVLADDLPPSVQLLGTVHARRGRWNPFLPDNDMVREGDTYVAQVSLKRFGGRHGDGVYAFRFTTDHLLCHVVKADLARTRADGRPFLVTGEAADQAHNVLIQVPQDGVYTIRFDPAACDFSVSPQPRYVTAITSMQLNGFVWDGEDMFEKFSERRPNHQMVRHGDWFELSVPLKKTGGISFRHDGVYQFLFSANGTEDFGFAACNFGPDRLTGGTGFSSSGGHVRHSAITVQVEADGLYTFRANPFTFHYEVVPAAGLPKPQILNGLTSAQLLGTIWPERSFDPTDPRHCMEDAGGTKRRLVVDLKPGVYSINFVFSRELFLDSMALGAWLPTPVAGAVRGRAWHGKPNEPNIAFEVTAAGRFAFTYDSADDTFAIEPETAGQGFVRARPAIESLQLVGDFDTPLVAWQPTSAANDMEQHGASVFRRTVHLDAGRTYHYKYSANRWSWLWVFADYELDGFGSDFAGRNPDPANSSVEALIRYGQLTTHGDPPALEYVCRRSGPHEFIVDLDTGGYGVRALPLPTNNLPPAQPRIPMTASDSQLAFFAAVQANHVSLVDQALADGFNPNIKDPSGRTPLMYAAARGHAYIVRVLVGAGADVNVLDNRMGGSPLHYCAMAGTAACARTLIGAGAHINLQNPSQGHCPLLDAIIYKNVAVTQVLLDAGANLNVKNNWGWGPADFIKALLGQPGTEKERINAINAAFTARAAADQARKDGMQLFQAVLAGDVAKVKARIAAGEDVNAVWPVEQGGNDGHTALIAAARDGQAEITALLLAAKADPYAVDSLYKALALHKSAYMGHPNSARPQVDALLDLDIQGPWQGFTPLHDAIWQGHPDVAEVLIAGGADVTLEAVTGQTPLDLAVATFGDNHLIVQLLRDRMASVG